MKSHTIQTPKWHEDEWCVERTSDIPQDRDGFCDYTEKKMVLRDTLTQKYELHTLLHELFHALCPHLNDDYIDRLTHSIASVLWKEGYRKK